MECRTRQSNYCRDNWAERKQCGSRIQWPKICKLPQSYRETDQPWITNWAYSLSLPMICVPRIPYQVEISTPTLALESSRKWNLACCWNVFHVFHADQSRCIHTEQYNPSFFSGENTNYRVFPARTLVVVIECLPSLLFSAPEDPFNFSKPQDSAKQISECVTCQCCSSTTHKLPALFFPVCHSSHFTGAP